jgi:hypothetical protein
MRENGLGIKWTRSQKKARKNNWRESDKGIFVVGAPGELSKKGDPIHIPMRRDFLVILRQEGLKLHQSSSSGIGKDRPLC